MAEIKFIDKGVCAPMGFTASGVAAHIKASRKTPDLALLKSCVPCVVAGLFTSNKVKAECVKWTKCVVERGVAQAVIANSGNANCCTGAAGYEVAKKMAALAAKSLSISAQDVAVCSTGVIGQALPIEKIENSMEALTKGLSPEGHEEAKRAIMTTDTLPKEVAVEFLVGGKAARIGAMCKGSGMIHINLGTMLCFLTTDVAITREALQKALSDTAKETLNCVSVDGDQSTNDTLLALSNGLAANPIIADTSSEAYKTFAAALKQVLTLLAVRIASDGEGATRLVLCKVRGTKNCDTARALAKSVIKSNLVKAAMFGRDANCGRILCALGYAEADFDPDKTNVRFLSKEGFERFFSDNTFDIYKEDFEKWDAVEVIDKGVGLAFDEEKASKILARAVVLIDVSVGDSDEAGWAFGCDLTYDYVKINGDYRT